MRDRGRVALLIAAQVALAALLQAPRAWAWVGFDILRPGSHASLGLGGDPMRSVLEDETGWWSEFGLSEPPAARLRYAWGEPPVEGARTRLDDDDATWSANARGRIARIPLRVGARFRRPAWSGSWQGEVGSLRVRRSGMGAEGAFRADVWRGLTLQAVAPLGVESRQVRSRPGAGLRYRVGSVLVAQGSWESVRAPERVTSDLHGEPIALSLNLGFDRRRLEGRVGLGRGLGFEGSFTRTRYHPLEGIGGALDYRLAPRGASDLGHTSLTWQPNPSIRLLARWTHLEGNVKGLLSWGGLRFGELNYGRLGLISHLLAAERTTAGGVRAILEAEWVNVDGRARGELESWPFTSTLVDLLGQRRIYRAHGRAQWQRWHVGLEGRTRWLPRWRTGLEWIDAHPEARLESWRPEFLVFGRADEELDVLGMRRLQLGVLSLGGSARLGSFEASLGVEQFVYAKTFEAKAGRATDDRPIEPGPVRARRRWPGGTQIEAALTRTF